ncbi:MAG: glucokinase [Nitrospirota bacterium]
MKNILSADIGGTNSRFAHFVADRIGELRLSEIRWLKTSESASFKNLIENLNQSKFTLKPDKADIAVFAVAGPVENGVRSSPPFISWDIDVSNATNDFGFKKCILINDFVAQAFACRSPVGKAAEKMLTGEVAHDAAVAVIGAGTGLGKAALVPDGKGGYIAVPSEGGHADFPFESEKEFEFQKFLLKELGDRYITGNKVVSGRGLSSIHQFLTGEKLDAQEVTRRFNQYPETLEWASRFYGRACRNYALETLSLGGLYIAGGVAAKNPELIKHKAFESEFRSSDTLCHLLEKIPVLLIKDENSGLWGGAVHGLQMLR